MHDNLALVLSTLKNIINTLGGYKSMEIRKKNLIRAVSIGLAMTFGSVALTGCDDESTTPSAGAGGAGANKIAYEVWASDQSNSVPNTTARGVAGSYVYVWDSKDVAKQIAGGAKAKPLGCGTDANKAAAGPCDIIDIFPANLKDEDGNALRDATDLKGFARLHGMLSDPQGKYMNFNLFKTGNDGGLVGIMDAEKKVGVALFRVAKTSTGRSVHMSFWNKDGSKLFVANLHGRIIERIDLDRDASGKITKATLRRDAAIGVGTNMTIAEDSHAYTGMNAIGEPLVSAVSGDYGTAVTGNFTPSGKCKQNGCDPADPSKNGTMGGRPKNVIICPIVSNTGMIYITMAAGGLLVADTNKTPMKIVAEYGNNEVNGIGCGGAHINDKVWFDNGVSAISSGEPMSIFGVLNVNDTTIANAAKAGTKLAENMPKITQVFKDKGNTKHAGNKDAKFADNKTGQVPGTTTRRDAHGMILTLNGKYIHVVDRIQNNMEVFDTVTDKHIGTYDLTSADGKGKGDGACKAASITDDAALPTNDPAPDLMGLSPDGKYIMAALRGPAPVTVTHGAQGSCPGVGVIEITEGGKSGKLVSVLRTTNVNDAAPATVVGTDTSLHPVYSGTERSDVHGATTRKK